MILMIIELFQAQVASVLLAFTMMDQDRLFVNHAITNVKIV